MKNRPRDNVNTNTEILFPPVPGATDTRKRVSPLSTPSDVAQSSVQLLHCQRVKHLSLTLSLSLLVSHHNQYRRHAHTGTILPSLAPHPPPDQSIPHVAGKIQGVCSQVVPKGVQIPRRCQTVGLFIVRVFCCFPPCCY